MFQGKKIRALEGRIGELEEQLRVESEAHARDLAALTELRGRIESEQRCYQDLRASCEKKLADLETQAQQFKQQQYAVVLKLREHKEEQLRQLDEEAENARAALQKEIDDGRAQAKNDLLSKVRAFSENYTYYLSQLKLMMDLLTKAAMNTGEVFLTSDVTDMDRQFRREMTSGAKDVVKPFDVLGVQCEPGADSIPKPTPDTIENGPLDDQAGKEG